MRLASVILSLGVSTLQMELASGQTNLPQPRLPSSPRFGARNPEPLRAPAQRENKRWVDIRLDTFHFKTNFVVAKVETGDEPPTEIAVMVELLKSGEEVPNPFAALRSNRMLDAEKTKEAIKAILEAREAKAAEGRAAWEKAKWISFTKMVPIDLGPEDGQRMIWIAAKWDGGKSQGASGTRVEVQRVPPPIVITNPVEQVTSRPMIQLQGYSVRRLQRIFFEVINGSQRVINGEGFSSALVPDMSVDGFGTNFFTCYDIGLALGTNTIILRCEDLAGNVATNTLNYVFSLEGDVTPPIISLGSPRNGQELSGELFTARGHLDDFTARMLAVASAGGRTNTLEGLVERNGYFWVEQIPLLAGTNYLSLTATDAAGNSSSTNLYVLKSTDVLTIDINSFPAEQLAY